MDVKPGSGIDRGAHGRLLFHGTSIYCLANIVDEDRLLQSAHWGKPGEPHGPRLSRCARIASGFVTYAMHWGEGGLLVLDRARLRQDFEIVSYVDKTYDGQDWPDDEQEEVPLTPAIQPLGKYLISIVCDPRVIELAQAPENLEGAQHDCGWGFDHEDTALAVASLRRLATHPLLNAWVPPEGFPIMGNWLQPERPDSRSRLRPAA